MKSLPGILFLLSTPLSVLVFIKVAAASGSELLALFCAVALYVLVAIAIGFVFSRRADLNGQSNQKCDEKHTEM